jgi:hypothetical protein
MQRSEQNVMKSALEHLKNDVSYPATKEDIVTACNNFKEIPVGERDWFDRTLPDREYNSPQEVLTALIGKV